MHLLMKSEESYVLFLLLSLLLLIIRLQRKVKCENIDANLFWVIK